MLKIARQKFGKKADKGDAMAWVHTDSPALISWGALSAGPRPSGGRHSDSMHRPGLTGTHPTRPVHAA